MQEKRTVRVAADRRKSAAAAPDSCTIYLRLRQEILSGALPPGEILNTVHIAQKYEISRTPVREALRMLQADGLVDAPYQHRMRVTAVGPAEVDAVYASWIMLQTLAVSLTVTKSSPEDLVELRGALEAMNKITPMNARSRSAWEKLHTRYNQLLVRHAGAEIQSMIENCWLRSERARRTNMRDTPSSWTASESAHSAIVEAFEQGSQRDAVRMTSVHLARIALEVISAIDPDYEPRAIREAVALTTGQREVDLFPHEQEV